MSVETERFPLVDVTYHREATIEDLRDAFEEYARIVEKHKTRVAWLIDMRQFDPLRVNAAARKEAARIFHEFAPALTPASAAEARVITSPLTRGIVTAFDWLTGANKWPCRQFSTMEGAEAWLRAELARPSSC